MTKSFIKADKLAAVVRGLASLVKENVLVGVPDSTTERGDDDEAGPMNNATLGYIHEHGSPAANIPARPHLIPGIENAKDKIADRFKKAGQFAMDGKKDKVRQQLVGAGQNASDSVRNMIDDADFEPLKPSTVASRYRGRTADGKKPARERKAEKEYRELIASGAQAAGMSLNDIQSAAGIKPLVNTGAYRKSITYVIRTE